MNFPGCFLSPAINLKKAREESSMTVLNLLIEEAGLSFFLPLLEKGVMLPARTGCSIRNFFCEQLGLPAAYLDQRIQTLFLDARPIDNVDTALLQDGSTLALSAAMPGLLGATMRKDGWYAAFRKDISQSTETTDPKQADGMVRVKLFNLVANEIGGVLLQRGVRVHGADLQHIARRHGDALQRHIRTARIEGHTAHPDQTFFLTLADRQVDLTISII
jgi:hypothetical protein